MKQDYTMYIYKSDKRAKTGERKVWTGVVENTDDNGMRRTVADLFPLYRPEDGFRFDWTPAMKTVKNLMTGKAVQIAHDTPRSCDPSSELYWTM